MKFVPAADPSSEKPASSETAPASTTTATFSDAPINGEASTTIRTNGEAKQREPKYPAKAHGWGLIGFDAPLKDEDVQFVKEKLATIGGKEVKFEMADG